MRSLLMVCFLLLGPSAVWACGNPLLWAMLFARVPEAKIVYEAELAARAEGLVTARVYDAEVGQPYHVWSKAWIMTLAEEMQPAVNKVLDKEETFTILLADEVAALRFSRYASPEFVPAAVLTSVRQFDVITTINALNGAWRHGLSLEDLTTSDLVWAQQGRKQLSELL
ncbi:hypothetical protein [Roseibium sp. SCP14]|uniref:hypothetical protein n=1 Tax=Roseibium sp. SCP14 TaxID=3141375 RepID=UPI003334F38F